MHDDADAIERGRRRGALLAEASTRLTLAMETICDEASVDALMSVVFATLQRVVQARRGSEWIA